MKQLFTANETRALDARTIELEGISSLALMERAAFFLARRSQYLVQALRYEPKYSLIAGPGNNGGDALAMARFLSAGAQVELWYPDMPEAWSSDFKNQFQLLQSISPQVRCLPFVPGSSVPMVQEGRIWVDGLFGTGFKGPVRKHYRKVIEALNSLRAPVFSIDVPSGFPSDVEDLLDFDGLAVKAKYTLTVDRPKRAMLSAEADPFVGDLIEVPLPFHPQALEEQWPKAHHVLLEPEDLEAWLPNRTKHSHKGTAGTGLIAGGSKDSMGALALATKAMMRAGSGKGFALGPQNGAESIRLLVPEAQYLVGGEHFIENWPDLPGLQALGIGPGLGTAHKTKNWLKEWMHRAAVPTVFDADALNLLAQEPTWLRFLPDNSILTPHPGEFDRLIGKSPKTPAERWLALPDFAQKTGAVVVLKGGVTAIASPSGKMYYCSLGSPALATGGSGDVLTGIITALLAQGLLPLQAALTGVLWHALAGNLHSKNHRPHTLLAGDLPDLLALV